MAQNKTAEVILKLKDKLSSKLGAANSKFKDLKKAVAGADTKFGKIKVTTAALISPLKRLIRLTRVYGRTARRAFKNNMAAATGMAKSFMTKVALPIVAGFAIMTVAGAKYEQSLASLQAITGVTNEQLGNMSTQIRKTATQFGLGASEVAKGLELIGSNMPALLTNPDLLAAVGRSAAIMAKATGISFDEAGASLTSIMNQFNLTGEQSDIAMNILAAGSKFGAANVASLAESIRNIGPAAIGAGVSMQETVGILEVLSTKGLRGAQAGTALRNIFTRMAVSMGKKFNPAVVGMAKALENVGKLSKKQLLKEFGLENVNIILLMIQNQKQIEKMTASITGTKVGSEQAAIAMATFAERATKLKQEIIDLLIQGFMIMKPILSPILGVMILIARKFGEFIKSSPVLTRTILLLAGAFTAVGTAISVIIVLAAGIATTTAAVAALGGAAGITAIVMGALGAIIAVMTSPIGLVIAGIVGLIAIFTLLWNRVKGFASFFISIWDGFKVALAPFMASLKEMFKTFRNFFSFVLAKFGLAEDATISFSVAGHAMGKVLGQVFRGVLEVMLLAITAIEKTIKGYFALKNIAGGVDKAVAKITTTYVDQNSALLDTINLNKKVLQNEKATKQERLKAARAIKRSLESQIAFTKKHAKDVFLASGERTDTSGSEARLKRKIAEVELKSQAIRNPEVKLKSPQSGAIIAAKNKNEKPEILLDVQVTDNKAPVVKVSTKNADVTGKGLGRMVIAQ